MELNKMEYFKMRQIETNRTNPILIPLIANKILKHCNGKTIRKCRLVCKLWEEEINRIFTFKKYPITLSLPEKYECECEPNFNPAVLLKNESKSTYNMKRNYVIISENLSPEFIPLIQQTLEYLKSNWSVLIKFLDIRNGPWTLKQLYDLFISVPYLEELTLSGNFILPKNLHHNLHKTKTLPINLSNLRSLHLNLKDEYLQNLANVDFLSEIQKNAPNLEEITCFKNKISDPHTTIFSKLLIRSVTHIFKEQILNSLDINVDLKNDEIDLLLNAKLPLKILHLPLDSTICAIKVNSLLQSLSKSLQKLKLTYRNCARKIPLLENLLKLKYLSIQGTGSEGLGIDNRTRYRRRSSFGIGFGAGNDVVINANDSVQAVNMLYRYTDIDLDLNKTISYVFNTVPVSLFPESSNVVLNRLKEIEINTVYYASQNVHNLITLFPNLTRIQMSFLDDVLLRCIVFSYPNLKSLRATEGFFTDVGLTGIGPEIQELVRNRTEPCCGVRLREFPSLLNLSNLETLELASPRVTNFGVIQGVAMCKWVQDLVLSFPQMDDQSLKILSQQRNLDTLIVKSGTFSKDAIEFAKKQMSSGRKFAYELDQH